MKFAGSYNNILVLCCWLRTEQDMMGEYVRIHRLRGRSTGPGERRSGPPVSGPRLRGEARRRDHVTSRLASELGAGARGGDVGGSIADQRTLMPQAKL